jgi:hypothetical protein
LASTPKRQVEITIGLICSLDALVITSDALLLLKANKEVAKAESFMNCRRFVFMLLYLNFIAK